MTQTPDQADERERLIGKLQGLGLLLASNGARDIQLNYKELADYILADYTPKVAVPDQLRNKVFEILGLKWDNGHVILIDPQDVDSDWAVAVDKLVALFASQATASQKNTIMDFDSEIAAAQERAAFTAQTNAIEWAIGLLGDHEHALELRRHYRDMTGVDPAPEYPITAKLAAQPKEDKGQAERRIRLEAQREVLQKVYGFPKGRYSTDVYDVQEFINRNLATIDAELKKMEEE